MQDLAGYSSCTTGIIVVALSTVLAASSAYYTLFTSELSRWVSGTVGMAYIGYCQGMTLGRAKPSCQQRAVKATVCVDNDVSK